MVINYTEKKDSEWYNKVNSASLWKKPILLVINRSFLISKKISKIKNRYWFNNS